MFSNSLENNLFLFIRVESFKNPDILGLKDIKDRHNPGFFFQLNL